MAAPTYDFFGASPVEVVFQTTDNFNGDAIADVSTGVITPGLVLFPSQAGGGRLDFHKRPIKIERITLTGAGALTVTMVLPDGSTTLNQPDLPFILPVGAYLKFVSSGGGSKQVMISGRELIPGANIV